jgi:hypothetical protein
VLWQNILSLAKPLVVIFALTLSFIEVTIALPAHLAGLDDIKRIKRVWL